MSDESEEEETFAKRDIIRGIRDIASFNPVLSASLLGLGLFTAVLSGIGLTFILPIVELAQEGNPSTEADGILLGFVYIYETLGVPFTLEFVVVGVALVMAMRFGTLFLMKWFKEILRSSYIRDLRQRGFENALNTRTAYYDEKGSDEVINAIITQTQYAGRVINKAVFFLQKACLALVFGAIALYLSPILSAFAAVTFVILTVVIQTAVEEGTAVGNRVAQANERVQEIVQTGTQGIRDVKMFGMSEELSEEFSDVIDQFVDSRVDVQRNKAGINSLYQFVSATMLFVLIYIALAIDALSLGGLGVFLFAMFRLAPIVSNLNNKGYDILADMPHLIRTQQFVDGLQEQTEPASGSTPAPESIEEIRFDEVSFAYEEGEPVLQNVSFNIDGGDFVAFVGQSGAGKSTIASLLARLYQPDSGRIVVNGTSFREFPIHEWREKVAIVRQNPFIFNETLRYNLTIGNRAATDEQIERACEVAMVTEFLDDLPDGYDSVLGDDGVQLSGGQKQRVAIARALLKTDAELLILDEATSDLDTNLEDRIQAALEETAREFTTLAIAHRLSTVRNADQIYTLENGRITESGKHEELLDEGGKYSELYRSQVATD